MFCSERSISTYPAHMYFYGMAGVTYMYNMHMGE